MKFFRCPPYYHDFQCIASACRDSCCIGWEIDIDADTLHDYRQVSGAFGRRLMEHIALPAGNSDASAHFITDHAERCPFLNKQNLCDIYITLGEQHLCQICTDHPRFYDWFTDGMEAGLGLCCEAAAALILAPAGSPMLQSTCDDAQMEPTPDEENTWEHTIEQLLFSMRAQLFDIIQSNAVQSFDEKTDGLFRAALSMQDRYDAVLFPGIQAAIPDAPDLSGISWTAMFWQSTFLQSLLDCYLSLEINEAVWRTQLVLLKDNLPNVLASRQAFLSWYQSNLYEYDQLLVYFLYRHFMKARMDDAVLQKVAFALISTGIIQLLDICFWRTEHTLPHVRQIDICKLYSKEIEYNEENTEKIASYPLPAYYF